MEREDSFRAALGRGVWKENPAFVQFLGMCPTLAVTNSVMNAIAMGLATTFVLVFSSAAVSAIRRIVPGQVRITTFIVIIATFVSVADFTLQALAPAVHKELGAFIALIVVNCIILGRAEAYAAKHAVVPSIADALGNGAGFTLAILMLGSVREVLGSGTFLGFQVLPASFEPWAIMILPPGGFLTLGLLLALFAWRESRRRERAEHTRAATDEEAA